MCGGKAQRVGEHGLAAKVRSIDARSPTHTFVATPRRTGGGRDATPVSAKRQRMGQECAMSSALHTSAQNTTHMPRREPPTGK